MQSELYLSVIDVGLVFEPSKLLIYFVVIDAVFQN